MPLTLRTVEPSDVSLNRLPAPIPGRRLDELQCVANGTLANMMRQLSTLSSHGAQLFEDLNKSLESIDRRLEALGLRSTNLQEKIQMGAGSGQDGGLHDNLRRKPYQTANDIDQHSLSRQTLPAAMMELYNQCDAPPCLRELDQFRDDGRSALKFYTDPGYFFELWKEQILKECQNDRRMRSARVSAAAANLPAGQRSPAKRRRNQPEPSNRRPAHQSQVLLNNYSGTYQHEYRSVSGILRPANEFVQFPTEYQAPQISRSNRNDVNIPTGMSRPAPFQQQLSATNLYDEEPLPPPPLNYRPPMIAPIQDGQATLRRDNIDQFINGNGQAQNDTDLSREMSGFHIAQQSSNNFQFNQQSNNFLDIDHEDEELPPPPPPLNSASQSAFPPLQPSSSGLQFLAPTNVEQTQMPSQIPATPPQQPIDSSLTNSSFQRDSQEVTNVLISNQEQSQPKQVTLAEELRAGMQLKKVQREEQARADLNENNVAALLRRRLAMGYADDGSTDDEKAGENEDDSEWDD